MANGLVISSNGSDIPNNNGLVVSSHPGEMIVYTTFDGLTERINYDNLVSTVQSDADGTISIWTKKGGSTKSSIVSFDRDSSNYLDLFWTSTNKIGFQVRDVGVLRVDKETTNTFTNDVWYNVIVKSTATNVVVKVNNVIQTFSKDIGTHNDRNWLTRFTVLYMNFGYLRVSNPSRYTGSLDQFIYLNRETNDLEDTYIYSNGRSEEAIFNLVGLISRINFNTLNPIDTETGFICTSFFMDSNNIITESGVIPLDIPNNNGLIITEQ